MQVDFVVVHDVETRAGFQVGQIARIGQNHTEEATDPGADFRRRRDQIDPDRLERLQVIRRVDVDLVEAAVAQLECRDGGFLFSYYIYFYNCFNISE